MKNIVFICGNSGSGKSTLEKSLRDLSSKYKKIISHTTRAMREGEEHGDDYYFITVDHFKDMDKKDLFLQTKNFSGNYYATTKEQYHDDKIAIVVATAEGVQKVLEYHRDNNIYTRATVIFLDLSDELIISRGIDPERLARDNVSELVRKNIKDNVFVDALGECGKVIQISISDSEVSENLAKKVHSFLNDVHGDYR